MSRARFLTALVLAPLVWPLLVVVRARLAPLEAWDASFLPIVIVVHAMLAYTSYILLGLPAIVYLRSKGRLSLWPSLVAGLTLGIAVFLVLAATGLSALTPPNLLWAAAGGASMLALFTVISGSPE